MSGNVMIELEPPPRWMKAKARRIRERIYDLMAVRGAWDAGFTSGLDQLALTCADHLRLIEEMRKAGDASLRIELLQKAAAARNEARNWLAEFNIIPFSQARAAIVDENGYDSLIAEFAKPKKAPAEFKDR